MDVGNLTSAFATMLLPDIILGLHHARLTGSLAVRSQDTTRELAFVKGELRAARSSNEHEKLGSWLVTRHIITEADKRATLLTQKTEVSPPLGHLLVGRNLVTQDVLESELELLTLKILKGAASLRDECVFNEGDSEQPDTLPNIATSQLVVFVARQLPDSSCKLHFTDLLDATVHRKESVDQAIQEYELTLQEKILLGKLHRDRSVSTLLEMSLLAERQFFQALYVLELAGIVVVVDEELVVEEAIPQPEEIIPAGPQDSGEIAALAGMLDQITHYDLFGLDQQASYQEVFVAWESFQVRYRQSEAEGPQQEQLQRHLEAILKHGEEAFSVLSTPPKRLRYNRKLRAAGLGTAEGSNGERTTTTDDIQPVASTVAINVEQVMQLREQGQLFAAIKLLDETCDLDPRPDLLVDLARLMMLNPQWSGRVLERLRRALEVDPRCLEAWMELARYWSKRHNQERQRKALEKALAIDPECTMALISYRSIVGDPALRELLQRVRPQTHH